MVNIAGPVATVFAFSERLQHAIDVDDTTACLLRFAGGATGMLATLHATSAVLPHPCLRLAGLAGNARRDRAQRFALAGRPSVSRFDAIDKERAELEAFADAVAAGVNS